MLECFAAQLADAVALNVVNNFFPRVYGPSFLENVHCTGRETHLFRCPRADGVYPCPDIDDVGVVCPLQGIVCMLMLFQLWVWYNYTYTSCVQLYGS